MKLTKRILAFTLALVLLFGCMGTALAADETQATNTKPTVSLAFEESANDGNVIIATAKAAPGTLYNNVENAYLLWRIDTSVLEPIAAADYTELSIENGSDSIAMLTADDDYPTLAAKWATSGGDMLYGLVHAYGTTSSARAADDGAVCTMTFRLKENADPYVGCVNLLTTQPSGVSFSGMAIRRTSLDVLDENNTSYNITGDDIGISIGNELNWKRVPVSATVYQNTSPNAVTINVPKSGSDTKTFVAEFYDEFGTKIFDNKTSGYDVVWSFTYGESELGTALTGVTADRSAATITVTNTAQSTEKPIVVTAACGAISDSIDVNIVREESKAESIRIAGQTAIFVDSAEDKEYTYTASAVDQYGLTINEPEVTWVTEPAQLPTGITLEDGTLTVSKTAAPSNVTIKLTAQADGQKSNELTINIARAQAVPSDIKIENGTKTANFSGGEDLKIPFAAVVTDQYGSTISNPAIEWSIESVDGIAVAELPTGLAIDESTGEVTLSNGVKSCTITINAAYKTLSVSHELQIYIDAARTASIRLSTNNPTATVDGVNDVEITMTSVVKDQYEAIIDNATVQYSLATETELETSGMVSITSAGVLTVKAKAPAGIVTVIAERDGVTAEKQITISRNAPVVAKAVIEGAKSITVPYDGVMTGVSEAYTFTLYDQYDDVYADQSAYSIYAASLPTDVSFSNGMLHVASSAASGEAVLRVAENGVTTVGEYTVIITREAPVVTSLSIYRNGAAVTEDSLVIPMNEARSYEYRAMLLDQYGTLIDGEIEWAIEGDGITLAVSETNPTMATVNVSPTAGDSGKLTATSGALSAEVTLNLFDLQISWPTETGTGTQADPLIEFNPDAVYGARNSEVVKSLTALGRGIVDGTVYTGKFALLNPDVVQNASDSAEITISFTIDYKDEYGDYSGNVYTKTYTTKIGKRPVTAKDLVYTLPTDAVYNGKRHDITVTSNITGIGDIGMKYTSGGVAAAPVNAGEYTAIALVPEAGNYAETVVELGTFTVAPAPVRLDVSGLTISKVYDGTNAFLYERDASGKAYMNGVLSGDIIAVVINGEFSTANAGETTAILTPTLSGANYTIADESRSVTVPATILTTELIGAAAIQHIESEQIYDTIEVGDTLEIKLSGVLNDVLAYQWYRDGQAISGATAITYKVVEEDRDTVLTAIVQSATGNCTGTITASGVKICSPIFMGSVTVVSSGEGVVGDTLNAVIDVNSSASDYTISWLRDGMVVSGVTGTEYGTTEVDRSCNIVCRIAASSSSSYSGVIMSDAFTVGVGPVSAPKTALVDYTYNSAAVTFSTDDLNGNSAVIYTGSIYNGRKRVAEVTSVGGCVFTGLEPETTYTIVVTARGDKNTGSVPGETIEFTTLPRPSETNAYIHTFTGYVSNSAVEDAVGTLAPGGRLTIITEADGAAITPSQLAMINQYEAGISVEAPLVGTEYDVGAFKDIDLGNNPLILMQCAAVETDSRLVMNYIIGGAPAYYVCAFSGSTEIPVAGNIKVTFAADENSPYLIAVKDEEIVASGLYNAEDGVVTIAASGKTVYVLISEAELMETELPFADVTEEDWFCEYVEYVYTTGIMDGMEETVFAPNTRTNRAMMATVLYRLFGGSESEDAPDITEVFSDINGDEWYVKYITWAYTKGILNGYEDGTVRPEAVITRQEMVVMIYRYCSACGIDVTTGLADISVYEDSGSVASWAQNAVSWCVGQGIIDGVTDTTLEPTQSATRAQLAAIIKRVAKILF